jgi:CRP/FNR family transcriptional regulator
LVLTDKENIIIQLKAIGNVKVCVFNETTLNKHLEKNPKLSRELLNITANELTLAQDRIRVLGKLTATERMANFILNISDQRARIKWQDNPVSLPMNRQDIADYLGLTIATVSREITKLKTSNIIKVLSASQIYIKDRTKCPYFVTKSIVAFQSKARAFFCSKSITKLFVLNQ